MGGQRSLERSVQSGLVNQIPVSKQLYVNANEDHKQNANTMMQFIRSSLDNDGNTVANQRSRSYRLEDELLNINKSKSYQQIPKNGNVTPQLQDSKYNQSTATLVQQPLMDISANTGVQYQHSIKSPFGLYPTSMPKLTNETLNMTPLVKPFSMTQTGFRMQDSQKFVKYPFKPAKKMFHGEDFRGYMGTSVELGDPNIVRYEIKQAQQPRTNYVFTPTTKEHKLNYNQFQMKVLTGNEYYKIQEKNEEKQSAQKQREYDTQANQRISQNSQMLPQKINLDQFAEQLNDFQSTANKKLTQEIQSAPLSPLRQTQYITKQGSGGAKLFGNQNDITLRTSKNGRYNYPNLRDTQQLKELVSQLQQQLGKDIVSRKVTINQKNLNKTQLRKVNSSIKLPSINMITL
eukprot:403362805